MAARNYKQPVLLPGALNFGNQWRILEALGGSVLKFVLCHGPSSNPGAA